MPSKNPLGTPWVAFCFRAKSNPDFLKANAINFSQSSTEPQYSHCLPWLTSDITKKFLKVCDRSSLDIIYLVSRMAKDLGCVSEEGFHIFLLRKVTWDRELVPCKNWSPGCSQEAGENYKVVCGRLWAPFPLCSVSGRGRELSPWGRQSLSGWEQGAGAEVAEAAPPWPPMALRNWHHGVPGAPCQPQSGWHWQTSRNQTCTFQTLKLKCRLA